MYYHISQSTGIFSELLAVHKRSDEAISAAKDLAIEVGADHYIGLSGSTVYGGGIGAFVFSHHPGVDWKKVKTNFDNTYWPKKLRRTKAVMDRIDALPVVQWKEFNDIIGHGTPIRGEKYHHWHPGVRYMKDHKGDINGLILIVGDSTPYKPHPEMIEVTRQLARTLLNNPDFS